MRCLYCGNEIGPFRLLRDREYCTSAHRKKYAERLGKALDQIVVRELISKKAAGFQKELPIQEGHSEHSGKMRAEFAIGAHEIRARRPWTMTIGGTLGQDFRKAAQARVASPAASSPRIDKLEFGVPKPVCVGIQIQPVNEVPAVQQDQTEGVLAPLLAPAALNLRPRNGSVAPATSGALSVATATSLPELLLETGARAFAPAEVAIPALAAADRAGKALGLSLATRLPGAAAPVRLPVLELPLADEAEQRLPDVLRAPHSSTGWMQSPAAEMATRLVHPTVTRAVPMLGRIAIPSIDCLKIARALESDVARGWMPAPEAAARFVQPLMAAAQIQPAFECAAPDLAELHVVWPDLPFVTQWMEPSEAETVEDEVHAKWRGAAIAFRPAEPVLPRLVHLFSSESKAGLAGAAQSPAAEPVESRANAGGARLALIPTLEIKAPVTEASEKRAAVPRPDLLPMDHFSQRLHSSPRAPLIWMVSEIGLALQPFAIQPAQEKLEKLTKKPELKPEPPKVVTLPQAKVRTSTLGLDRGAKIAACLLAAAFLWLGFRSGLTNSSKTTALNSIGSASDVSSENASGRIGTSAPATGTMARIRRAIADRASVEMTDSFRNGMENWGAAPKAWARGWSRHPDGYVRTGELALFGPSSTFTDYRLEFYGQIESKSIGWVVRAKDRENYYAMKFTVVEPGIRPVIALTHYPVVGGKRGQRVTTPLNVMVHNNQPYHVSVDVRGNRFTTSIEGEQVGSWTDTTVSAGGIGFFSEAGERARLYWMKVSKNQDWVGRFCEYLAGEGGGHTAELWRSRMPAPRPEPVRTVPAEAVLAAEIESNSPGLQRTNRQERINVWTS